VSFLHGVKPPETKFIQKTQKSTEQKFDFSLYFFYLMCYNEKPNGGTILSVWADMFGAVLTAEKIK
jgi:hypothetical protein